MGLGNGASAPVRPTTETRSPIGNGGTAEIDKPDFDRALDQALAPLEGMMGPRARAAALARARREILAAVEVAMKAEKRRLVAALTPAQLRKEVRELLDAYTSVLDYLDDLDRQPVIAAEVRRLRARGEIPW
jgi:hypothetical protein